LTESNRAGSALEWPIARSVRAGPMIVDCSDAAELTSTASEIRNVTAVAISCPIG
jgi:hypothetical protein